MPVYAPLIIVYMIAISVLSVIMTVADKLSARRRGERISEKVLMSAAVLGGSLCMLITMLLIRHKTHHKKFMLGLPLIVVFQCLVFALLYLGRVGFE